MTLLARIQKAQGWWLFARREEPASAFAIIKWWELRRIPYNLIVGATGILTCAVVLALAASEAENAARPEDGDLSLLYAGFMIIAYGIGANVCFTGGWIAELLARKVWPEKAGHFAPISFALGLLFSVALTLAPAVFFGGILLLRLLLR